MLKQSLTLQFFFLNFFNFITKSYYNMITIHTNVTNHFYFLIIKLYKFKFKTQTFTHSIIHTNNIITKNMHTINIRYTHTHNINL